MKCFCNALRICGECRAVVIDRPRQRGYFETALAYSRTSRDARRANGEYYACPRSSWEYLLAITRESEDA